MNRQSKAFMLDATATGSVRKDGTPVMLIKQTYINKGKDYPYESRSKNYNSQNRTGDIAKEN